MDLDWDVLVGGKQLHDGVEDWVAPVNAAIVGQNADTVELKHIKAVLLRRQFWSSLGRGRAYLDLSESARNVGKRDKTISTNTSRVSLSIVVHLKVDFSCQGSSLGRVCGKKVDTWTINTNDAVVDDLDVQFGNVPFNGPMRRREAIGVEGSVDDGETRFD